MDTSSSTASRFPSEAIALGALLFVVGAEEPKEKGVAVGLSAVPPILDEEVVAELDPCPKLKGAEDFSVELEGGVEDSPKEKVELDDAPNGLDFGRSTFPDSVGLAVDVAPIEKVAPDVIGVKAGAEEDVAAGVVVL